MQISCKFQQFYDYRFHHKAYTLHTMQCGISKDGFLYSLVYMYCSAYLIKGV